MKKIKTILSILILFVLILIIAIFVGCGGENDQSPTYPVKVIAYRYDSKGDLIEKDELVIGKQYKKEYYIYSIKYNKLGLVSVIEVSGDYNTTSCQTTSFSYGEFSRPATVSGTSPGNCVCSINNGYCNAAYNSVGCVSTACFCGDPILYWINNSKGFENPFCIFY